MTLQVESGQRGAEAVGGAEVRGALYGCEGHEEGGQEEPAARAEESFSSIEGNHPASGKESPGGFAPSGALFDDWWITRTRDWVVFL